MGPTTTICFVEPTAMTAASPGPQTTLRSGTLRMLSAAARPKRSEKLSLEIAVRLLTVDHVAHIAVNATCPGRQQTLQERQPIVDARDHGEHEQKLSFTSFLAIYSLIIDIISTNSK